MASRHGTAPPSPCPVSSFPVHPPRSPWVSSVRSGPSVADAARASASAISTSSRLEREHYLRQNRDISRLCSLKSAQIRQFEAKLSRLERENLGMRIALREAENGLAARNGVPATSLSSSSSTSANFSDLQDADAPGRAEDGLASKAAQGKQNDEYESAEDVSSDSNDGAHRRKRRKLSRQASPFGPKTILLSKLNQVQAIYQREHQALCTMMASFNSTSRFYKDLLQQLEEHALSSRKGTDDESSGEHSLEPREPTSHRSSQQHQQRVPDLNEGILQTPRDSPQKRQHRKGSSGSSSRTALKDSPRQSSSSASPSPFFEPNRYLRRRTRQPQDHQKPKSPVARSTDLTLSSSKARGPTLETALPPSEKTTQDLDDSEENHMVVPRLIRTTAGNVYSMNALPRIAEDRPLELSGTISGTKDSFTVLRSRLSVSTEYLESTAPRDVTIGEPESDRSDQSNVQQSVTRKLKPSSLSPDVQKAKQKNVGPSGNRVEKSRRIGDNWATRDPEGERAKSIALSKALLAKFSKSAAPSDESGDRSAPEHSRAASMQAAASDSSSNFDDSGGIVNAASRLEDGGGNDLHGANTLGEMPTNEDNTSKTGTAIHSPRHNGLSRRPIIARRRGFLRATPSPLVKSRSAIRAQHLKVMTPAQLLRRMNKTLLGTSRAPALPKSITRNADYSSISSIKAPSLFSGTSTSTKANNTLVGNALNEQDCGSSEGTISTKKLMPPPPPPDPNFPRRHRSKLISTAGVSVRRSAPIRSTDDSGEKESLTTGDRGDDRAAGEHASNQEDLEGTSSRLSSKRAGAPSIAYKLPSLREVLYPGDPGTYSMKTPRRPATKSSHKAISTSNQ